MMLEHEKEHWDWRDRSACKGRTDLDFFPWPSVRTDPEVMKLCARCPVWEPCLAYGMASPQNLGVLAGTREEHRDRLRRKLGGSGHMPDLDRCDRGHLKAVYWYERNGTCIACREMDRLPLTERAG